MINDLMSIVDVKKLINDKRRLVLAGDESVLDKLPAGNWIGGTIPYFMTDKGGTLNKDSIFVNDITECVSNFRMKEYSEETIQDIIKDKYENGFTYLLLPGFSKVLSAYAIMSQSLHSIYDIPVTGWVTGIDLQKINETPKVYNGLKHKKYNNKALAMHVELPSTKVAKLDIINIFKQGAGDQIQFETEGFEIKQCFVNGEKRNFAKYLLDNKIDIRFPLVADYSGAMINISIRNIDEKRGVVKLYSPVRIGVDYKFAKAIENYIDEFDKNIPKERLEVASSFNCILNYVYSDLEGKQTGIFKGPFTFGEIAYILVNQTMVYLTITNN